MAGFFRRVFKARDDRADAPPDPSKVVGADGATIERLARFVVTLSTELWRVRGRFAKLTAEERAPLRLIETSIDKMSAALESLGIRVDDPAGRTWDERDQVKVLVFEPTEGLKRAKVIETVKPAVFLGESLLAPGEVVVAVPKEKSVAESQGDER